MKQIVLDSAPLGLLTQRQGVQEADACKAWLAAKISQGVHILVPEIIDYELRRELIRAGKTASIHRLDQFIGNPGVIYVPLHTASMRLAAQLWAGLRNQGVAVADPKTLDVDVILAAQVLTVGFPTGEFIVATSNVRHLSRLVPAEIWSKI